MRHPYHSPAMILMIRRANEVSVAKEGLGIPWRHRLGTSERREFVMAEVRRPGMGRVSTRGSELDKQRAVLAARCPKDSKFGECLLNVNTKQDPMLQSRLGKITTEKRRMEFKMTQLRQHFVKTNPCLNHEPLILVERPASPQVRRRARLIQNYGEDPDTLSMPGYMRPLRSRCRTPSTLTTIDAFTLKTRKKRNVWEEAMDDREPPSFKSTIRPSARLTRQETAALRLGWDAHKLKAEPKETPRGQTSSTPHGDTGTPFVTQLPTRKDVPKTPDGRLLKSVVLDQLLAINSPPSTSAGARKASTPPASQQRRRKVAISKTPLVINT